MKKLSGMKDPEKLWVVTYLERQSHSVTKIFEYFKDEMDAKRRLFSLKREKATDPRLEEQNNKTLATRK